MGKCDLCGQDAGFLRKRHKECEAQRSDGESEMVEAVAAAVFVPTDVPVLWATLQAIASRSYLGGADLKSYVVMGWERAVEHALDDDILSSEEEASLTAFAATMGLSQSDLDHKGAYMRVVKAAVIRDLLEGEIPQRLSFSGDLPFNLQKAESLVWVFTSVDYLEEHIRTHYVGGSQGVSVKVAKGLYYRASGFRGHPVQTPETITLGNGLLGVTTKNIYFASNEKSFRIPYAKIVSFTAYSDGIGLQRDAQSAKPQGFVTGDGWFTYNLITNLAKM